MAPRTTVPDSIKANPLALQALTRLIAKNIPQRSDQARFWYNHPGYKNILAPVREDKFRREYNKQMMKKYAKAVLTPARAAAS